MLILTTGILWSCNSTKNPENKEPFILIDTAQHHQIGNAEELTLNNSAKWKADAITSNNVNNLQTIIDDFNKGGDKTLPGFQKTGNDLQKGIAKMINECRMQGPGHDALHEWLQPLLKQVNEFRQSTTTAGAAEMLEVISKQVNRYFQYFE